MLLALGDAAEATATLLPLPRCRVTIATDAEQVLELGRTRPFALAVIGWNLGGTPGALCRQFRQLPLQGQAMLVAVAGVNKDEQSPFREALAAGADDFLVLPPRATVWGPRLEVVLQRIADRLARAVAEQRATVRRQEYVELVNALPVVVFRLDLAGRLSFINEAIAEYGYHPRELLGKPLDALVRPRHGSDLNLERLHKIEHDRHRLHGIHHASTSSVSMEVDVVGCEGQTSAALLDIVGIAREDGSEAPGALPGGMVGVIRDISDLKESEKALIRQENMAAIGTLAGGVAHQFNNILTVITGHVELLMRDSSLPGRTLDRLRIILDAANRASTISSNLAAVTQQGRRERELSHLDELASRVLGVVREEFQSEGIQWQVNMAASPLVLVSPGEISQVMLHLLSNARHAMLESPRKILSVSCGEDADGPFLQVRDTGMGIPAEDLARIFTPFFSTKGEHARGPGAQTSVRGVGLGLSICQTIVRELGGEILVDSIPGVGTTFTVRLPRVQGQTQVRGGNAEAANPTAKAWILVLDDEEFLRDYLAEILRQEGFGVRTFAHGDEALAELTRSRFDLLLVDMQMPGMSGLEFIRQVRASALPQQPRVMIVSGLAYASETQALRELAVTTILEKPFTVQQLYKQVLQSLEGAAPPAN